MAKRGVTETYLKGEEGFDEALQDLRDGYVDAKFPNLTSYAYQADHISIEDGEAAMEDILSKIVEIQWAEGEHPRFKLKGDDKLRFVEDTDDFPQPDDQPFDEADDGLEEEEEEEEDEGGEEE